MFKEIATKVTIGVNTISLLKVNNVSYENTLKFCLEHICN